MPKKSTDFGKNIHKVVDKSFLMWYYITVHIVDARGGVKILEANILRGKVVEKFGTIVALADRVGWSYRRTADIVSGRQEATAQDISTLADALEITEPNDFMCVFFADTVHNVD